MDTEAFIDRLNDLLTEESHSVLQRLRESQMFVSWASADDARDLTRMIEEDDEHRGWLVQAISDLGGGPLPVVADIYSADMHFLELRFVLPRALADRKRLLIAYESAASDVASNTLAADVVTRITDRLRRHVERLESLAARVEPASS